MQEGYELNDIPQGLYVKFHTKSVQDKEASKEAGYTVYSDQPYLMIVMDNGKSVLDRPIKTRENTNGEEDDREEYPLQWKMFQEGCEEQIVGIPLEKLFVNSPARADMYADWHIHTVEQLATTADVNLQQYGMGALEDKKAAVAFLEKYKTIGNIPELEENLKQKDEQIELLHRQISSMQEQMANFIMSHGAAKEEAKPESITLKPATKRGRPRKES